jgi:hypothetical protein
VRNRASDLGPRASDLGPRTSDLGLRTSDFGVPRIRRQILRLLTHVTGPYTSGISHPRYEVRRSGLPTAHFPRKFSMTIYRHGAGAPANRPPKDQGLSFSGKECVRVCFNLEESFCLDLRLPREFIMAIILGFRRNRRDSPSVRRSDWRTRTCTPGSEDRRC